ncbi:response regulator transcription factor [Agrilutibacter solisilvae]|uniref:Response regulator n=1 Tax=Agrilutibacter solisilvae TaxID=2763317 RepID=A0A974XZT7_9GAMM|nr:response regulator [Lysobacter solisilvae]QSX78792.1 response regulator [Lysobacter solisilvae]
MQAGTGQVIVYIVDDDESVRTALARLMRSAGLEPRPYGDPARFLSEVGNIANGVILLDITMPLHSGTDVLHGLRSRQIVLPVIAVSARDDDDTRKSAREAGARLFLQKPADNQALLDAIHWLAGSAAQA